MAEMVTAVFGGHIDITRRRAEGTGRAESPNTGSARLHPRTTSRGSDRYASRDPSALPRPRPISNPKFKDDAVESEMIAILDEWLQTVVPD